MKALLTVGSQPYQTNLDQGYDLSLPLGQGHENVNCYFAPLAEFTPVRHGDFTGSVAHGGPVNFFTVHINPHGNGTHTECVGHIDASGRSIRETLQRYHFSARLISVYPQRVDNGDRMITEEQIAEGLGEVEALIIRSLPNGPDKRNRNYSGTNPPYLTEAAARAIAAAGVRHLLVDLPSVDPEEDGGKLLAHRAFWGNGQQERADCTITELIFVDNTIKDGLYLLNLQTASFELDVSPAKPVIFPLERVG